MSVIGSEQGEVVGGHGIEGHIETEIRQQSLTYRPSPSPSGRTTRS